jgi:hypothetical protein
MSDSIPKSEQVSDVDRSYAKAIVQACQPNVRASVGVMRVRRRSDGKPVSLLVCGTRVPGGGVDITPLAIMFERQDEGTEDYEPFDGEWQVVPAGVPSPGASTVEVPQ